MAVLDAPRGFLVGWNGSFFETREIPRDEAFIKLLLKQLERFWGDHVEAREEPAADYSDGARESLLRLHPKDNGLAISFDSEIAQLAEELDELKDLVKKGDKRASEISNRIRQTLGDNTYGVFHDGSGFSYKTQNTSSATAVAALVKSAERLKGLLLDFPEFDDRDSVVAHLDCVLDSVTNIPGSHVAHSRSTTRVLRHTKKVPANISYADSTVF
jgi:hypothetical protein